MLYETNYFRVSFNLHSFKTEHLYLFYWQNKKRCEKKLESWSYELVCRKSCRILSTNQFLAQSVEDW